MCEAFKNIVRQVVGPGEIMPGASRIFSERFKAHCGIQLSRCSFNVYKNKQVAFKNILYLESFSRALANGDESKVVTAEQLRPPKKVVKK